MPLINADYKWFHSTEKLGGAITATPWQNGVKHDLFDKFTADETAAGNVYYACCFFQNKNANITMEDISMFISTITPSDDTEIRIGLAPEGIDSDVEVIADENTAPAGVTFSAPLVKGNGLNPENLAPDGYIGVWFEYTVNANTEAKAGDGWTIATYAEYTE